MGGDFVGRLLRIRDILRLGVLQRIQLGAARRLVCVGNVSGQYRHVGLCPDPAFSVAGRCDLGGFSAEKEGLMTRKQQIGAWLLLSLMLAIAAYRWLNLPQ